MKNNLILRRHVFGYNPLFIMCYDEMREINDILFYNENGVVFHTNCGWFYEGENYNEIITDFTYKMKRKISFDKNECFITISNMSFRKKMVDLYIPISFLENYTFIANEHYGYDKDKNEIVRNKYCFNIKNYKFIVTNHYKILYTPKNGKRYELFKKLNINETAELKDALIKLRDNNIDLNDIFE